MNSSELTAAIREEVAGILGDEPSKVDVNTNLFDLGLHSLSVMRLVRRVQERFNFELTLRTVFDHPTIAGLSAALLRSVQRQ